MEKSFRCSESLISNCNELTIRILISCFKGGADGSSVHLSLEVKGNVAELFLDVSDDFTFSSCGEGVSSFSQDLHQVVSQVTAGQVKTEDSMGEGISFVDWDGVSDT